MAQTGRLTSLVPSAEHQWSDSSADYWAASTPTVQLNMNVTFVTLFCIVCFLCILIETVLFSPPPFKKIAHFLPIAREPVVMLSTKQKWAVIQVLAYALILWRVEHTSSQNIHQV